MNVEENFVFIWAKRNFFGNTEIFCFVRYNIKLHTLNLLLRLFYVKQDCAPQRNNQTWLYILGDVLSLSRLDVNEQHCAIVNTLGKPACVRKREREREREKERKKRRWEKGMKKGESYSILDWSNPDRSGNSFNELAFN